MSFERDDRTIGRPENVFRPSTAGNGGCPPHWLYLCSGLGISFALALLFFGLSDEIFVAHARLSAGTAEASFPPREHLLSETVLRHVVESEKLAEDSEYAPRNPGLGEGLSALINSGNGMDVGNDRATRAVRSLAATVTEYGGTDEKGIEIEASSRDPQKAARIANALAQAVLIDQKEGRAEFYQRAQRDGAARLAALEARVRSNETRLAEFRTEQHLVASDPGEAQEVARELAATRVKVSEEWARSAEIQRVVASGRFVSAPTKMVKSAVLEHLWQQYSDIREQEAKSRISLGDQHPALLSLQTQLKDLRRRLGEEWKARGEAALFDYETARRLEAGLIQKAEALSHQNRSTDPVAVRLRELESELATSRAAYEHASRGQQIGSEDFDAIPLWIIEPAPVPATALHPPRGMVLTFASMIGLVFGAGGLFVRQRALRPRSSQAMKRDKGCLHRLPPIAKGFFDFGSRSGVPLRKALTEFRCRPNSTYSSSVRKILAGLTPNRHGASKVLILSERRGMGATTFAFNLGQAAAAIGKRVLLIEAHWRNPTFETMIDRGSRSGLIDFLGTRRVVHQLNGSDLFIVPFSKDECEAVARIAARPRYRCIHGIAGHFDLVILDGGSLDQREILSDLAESVDQVLLVGQQWVEDVEPFGLADEYAERSKYVPNPKARKRSPTRSGFLYDIARI